MANGHGGKRSGAGRKAGGVNKRHSRTIVLEAIERGETPLQYFMSIMKDQTQPTERRDWAATQAAPFCHPRLAAIDQTNSFKGNPFADILAFIDGRTATLNPAARSDDGQAVAPVESLPRH